MKVLAMVLAGGQGSTASADRGALQTGGAFRRPLSHRRFRPQQPREFEISGIYLLVQYKSQSLIEHVNKSWGQTLSFPGQFITVVPPQMREGSGMVSGHFRCRLSEYQPDRAPCAGHGRRFRRRPHLSHGRPADGRFSSPERRARLGRRDSGTARRGLRVRHYRRRRARPIRGFLEKPKNPPAMASDPKRAYGSMGNYLFNTDVLLTALREAKERGEHDFGHNILPRLIKSHRVFAYNFADNRVPGVADYEQQAYWRDVGTIDAYFDAHRDTMGEQPRFKLFNPQWVINSSNYQGPTARILSGQIENSTLGAGTLVKARGFAIRSCAAKSSSRATWKSTIASHGLFGHSARQPAAPRHRRPLQRYRAEYSHRLRQPPTDRNTMSAKAESWSSPRGPKSRMLPATSCNFG